MNNQTTVYAIATSSYNGDWVESYIAGVFTDEAIARSICQRLEKEEADPTAVWFVEELSLNSSERSLGWCIYL